MAANNAVEAQDGGSWRVDLTGSARSKISLLDKNWCKVFDEEKEQYQLNKRHIPGAAIMTPFRVWAGDGRTVYPNAGYVDFR